MRSRTDVAGLLCAVVSGRGGGLTCAAAVVVLYQQPRRACAPPGSGAEPRGVAGGRGGPHVTSGSGGRRRVTGGRGQLRYTRDTYAAAGPRRRTDYEGGAPPKLRIIYVLRPDRRARKAGQPQAGLSWASAQLRQTQIMRDASFAARPRAGKPLEGTEGRRGLSMRAGVPSGTQGDGPGRWPPMTRRVMPGWAK